MTYTVKVSKDNTPDVFDAISNMIDDVHVRHRNYGRMDITRAITKEFGIVIHEYDYNDLSHKVEFPNKHEYLLFLMKWA